VGASRSQRRGRSAGLRDLYRAFASHLAPYRAAFAAASGLMALAALVRALAPFPLKWILDFVLLREPLPQDAGLAWLAALAPSPRSLLGLLCLSMVALVLVRSVLSYAHRTLLATAARRANNDIRNAVFDRLQLLPLSFHSSVRTGDLVVRLTNDVNTVRRLFVDSVAEVVRIAFAFAWVAILMLAIDWRLTLLALGMAPLVYLLSARFTRRVQALTRLARAKESEVGSILQESVTSMPVVQAFSQRQAERERFEREAGESLRADLRHIRLSRGFGRAIDLLVACGTALIVYAAGCYALDGALDATVLVLFVPWLKDLYAPVEKLPELLVAVSGHVVGAERVAELLRADATLRDAEGATAAPRFRGHVRFENVSFGYRPGVPVLRGVDFEIRAGETVAVVGPSGAGKTTLASLLLRFADPWEGRIAIDGQDLRSFRLESLRSRMSVVLQDAPLLARSVRENIALGRPDASFEEVVDAARRAQVHDFAAALPRGYDTVLSERGADLSGGQRQRIALARAILRDAPIVILDEPLGALDPLAEARLSRAVAEATRGRTTFVIAHRFATVERADRILVLDQGRLVGCGSHAQLLASCPLYRRLYETQYPGARAEERSA
jgi:ABC-type multidrug transport system fused ATPase/permease subunit